MKERPIIFSTPMVQAILDGRKTMTRRIVKDRHFIFKRFSEFPPDLDETSMLNICPYGQPGDVLWVREDFSIIGNDIIRDEASGAIIKETPLYVFKGQKQPHIEKLFKWKSPRYMPKSACRIWLEVVSVKVERLQEISEQDAISEGIEPDITGESGPEPGKMYYYNYAKTGYRYVSALDSFKSLWQTINGKDSWELNPFVWAIEFRKIDKLPTPVSQNQVKNKHSQT